MRTLRLLLAGTVVLALLAVPSGVVLAQDAEGEISPQSSSLSRVGLTNVAKAALIATTR